MYTTHVMYEAVFKSDVNILLTQLNEKRLILVKDVTPLDTF